MKKPSKRARRRQSLEHRVKHEMSKAFSEVSGFLDEGHNPEFKRLFTPGECRGKEVCVLSGRPWGSRRVWSCKTCGFQTFELAEAAPRAAAVGRSIV